MSPVRYSETTPHGPGSRLALCETFARLLIGFVGLVGLWGAVWFSEYAFSDLETTLETFSGSAALALAFLPLPAKRTWRWTLPWVLAAVVLTANFVVRLAAGTYVSLPLFGMAAAVALGVVASRRLRTESNG